LFEDTTDTSNVNVKETSIVSETSKVPGDDDKFGAMVSSKLLLMTPLQRLLFQKIISEILLKGQLNMLKSSLSPVLVTGYMKNSSNGVSNTSVSNEHLSSNEDDDNDPLMFQIKQEDFSDTNFQTLEIIKDEFSWSDDNES